LSYDAEGRLVSLTSEEYARTIAYNEAGLISEVIEGYILVEEEGEEGDEEGDDNGIAPLSETEIEYSSKITFEYDAEGRLVKKDYYFYDAYETMEFYWGESEVYTYDENGNCVKKEAYEVTEENELKSFPYSVTEYIYDLTINNENVYKFEYPHFAFINYVEPSYANILVKEMSFYSYYDEDVEEVVSHSYEVTAYNYNPAVVLLPLTPMNLTAEVLSATEVELAWAGFPDAESFTLYQGETVIAEGLVDPYYTVENLEMGVEYCFAVMATNSVGNSEVSETVCVTIELPAAPANLVAEATSDTEIALTWDEVPGIYSYNVYQVVETAEETTYELLGEAWWAEYTVSELTAETEYSFVVKAVSNVGESAASNVATATTLAPAAPTVPAAPVVTGSFEGDKVILEWEAVEGALAYNLYFGGNLLAGPFEDLVVEIQVPEPGEYCFTVTAVNEVGESEHSEEVCVTVTVPEGMEAPAAPVLEVTLDGNKAILSWEAVEGATYYDVYIGSTPEQAQYLGTATMEDLPISLELPEPGEYCFFVVAYNLAGASEPSNVACVNYGEGVEENEVTFNIYPNPVSDNLVIETEANIEAVTIYTVTGVVVYNEVEFSNNTINVSDFANGVYIMKVRTENGEAVQRFIKK
jgi:YD repeat-containing protein